jgi:hypothetical protein
MSEITKGGNRVKIYLAARYGRHLELQGYAKALTDLGHVITSRWIWGRHQVPDDGLDPLENAASEQFAKEDWIDLSAADLCLSFTEPMRTPSRGGRHVEFGIALAWMRRVWIVGPREHVFHCLEGVKRFETFEDIRVALAAEQGALGLQSAPCRATT